MNLTIRDVTMWLIITIVLAIGSYYEGKIDALRHFNNELAHSHDDLDRRVEELRAKCDQAQRTCDAYTASVPK